MTELSPIIISAIVLGGVGALYYFKDPILNTIDPDQNRNIGTKYMPYGGSKKSRRKGDKNGKYTRKH